MPLYTLNEKLWFPPVSDALPDGLLAIGGDLSPERLILAYKSGIFPWFDGDLPLWWSPNPRFVLFPDELKVSKSMKSLLKKEAFNFTINTCFNAVIKACKLIDRKEQPGTWITDEVQNAYTLLHQMGYAHSAEVWLDNELVGGLYGIRLGNIFFGESMFTVVANASKYGFIKYAQILRQQGVVLIDCQVYTSHLESLGASMIPRNMFLNFLKDL